MYISDIKDFIYMFFSYLLSNALLQFEGMFLKLHQGLYIVTYDIFDLTRYMYVVVLLYT